MAVVCAGPKAILDVPATLEYLETRGVPVVAVGQAELPGFYARSSGIPAPATVADVAGRGRVRPTHLGLGLAAGILVCVPVPADEALPDDVARAAVERAVAEADAATGSTGPALTPWLLARIAVLTDGASVRANTALIVNDARVAGELAVASGRDSPIAASRPHARILLRDIRLTYTPAVPTTGPTGPARDSRRPLTACGSTRAVRARTSKRSSAPSARSSTSAAMKDVLLLEAPDGFIVQGLVTSSGQAPARGRSRWAARSRRR